MRQWFAERKLLVVLTAVAVLMVSLTVLFTLGFCMAFAFAERSGGKNPVDGGPVLNLQPR